PMDTRALTRDGWKTFDELVLGEEILAYDLITKTKKWTPLLEKVKFQEADVYTLTNKQFRVRATANHRWFVRIRNTANNTYEDVVLETKDLTSNCNLIVNAPTENYKVESKTNGILNGKNNQYWIGRL